MSAAPAPSTALRLVHGAPSATARRSVPKAPTVPPAPAPGREPYCLGQPVEALRSRVEMARELLALTGRPFDWDSAVADYMAETDGGRPETFGLEDRAARWGWTLSKNAMWKRMARIREDAFDRADLYRTKRAEAGPGDAGERPANAERAAGEQNEPHGDEKQQSGERPANAERTPGERALIRSRASDLRPQTSEDGDAAEARARAGLVLERMGFDDPALVAEAQDRAAEAAHLGAVPDDLPRLALCLGLTGAVPHPARDALEALTPPDAATVLVVVLRTGDRPRTAPRTNYLRTLAASLADHDRSDTYTAAASAELGTDPGADAGRDGRAGGTVHPSHAPVPAGAPPAPAGTRRDAGAPRGRTGAAGLDPARRSASERAGQIGPERGAEMLAAARAYRLGRARDGDAGDD